MRETNLAAGRTGHDGDDYVLSGMVMAGTGLSWTLVLAVARAKLTPAEAREQYAASRGRDVPAEYDLITVREMAAILDHSRAKMDEVKNEPGFPVQVAQLGRAAVFSRSDFECWQRREPLPARKHNERQHEFLGGRDLAELLGLSLSALHAARRRDRSAVVPPALGKIGKDSVWSRHEVQLWRREHPERAISLRHEWRNTAQLLRRRGHATTGEVAQVTGRNQQAALHRLKVWQAEGKVVRHGREAGSTAIVWALPPGDAPDNPAP